MENPDQKQKLIGLIDLIMYIIELIKRLRRKKDAPQKNVEQKL